MTTFARSRRITPALLLGGIAIIVTACAHGGGTNATRAPCVLAARDSAFAAGGPLYRDCAVDRVANRLPSSVAPDWRPSALRAACYSADLTFVVDSTGAPEIPTARLVRSNDSRFGDAIFANLRNWRYEPAMRNKRPVRQLVVLHEMAAVSVTVVAAGIAPVHSTSSPRMPTC